jgi:hypothetical protein
MANPGVGLVENSGRTLDGRTLDTHFLQGENSGTLVWNSGHPLFRRRRTLDTHFSRRRRSGVVETLDTHYLRVFL